MEAMISLKKKYLYTFLISTFVSAIVGTCVAILKEPSDKEIDYRYEYTEAGYLVTKTTENNFHYNISDNVATPIFEDNFYYTIFVDDKYIKVQVPYNVFIEHNLGDHITVFRNYNDKTEKYKDYDVYIMDIHIPAVEMEKESQ